MRPRGSISTSAIRFTISKMVSAVRADATEVPTSRHKSSSTNGLAATGPQSGSKFQKKISGKQFLSPPLRPEKYAESIGEIRFQIRSQSREIFATLCPPCLLYTKRRNAATTTTRAADTMHWAMPCAAISSFVYLFTFTYFSKSYTSRLSFRESLQKDIAVFSLLPCSLPAMQLCCSNFYLVCFSIFLQFCQKMLQSKRSSSRGNCKTSSWRRPT